MVCAFGDMYEKWQAYVEGCSGHTCPPLFYFIFLSLLFLSSLFAPTGYTREALQRVSDMLQSFERRSFLSPRAIFIIGGSSSPV